MPGEVNSTSHDALSDVSAEDHHNQVDDETGTFDVGGTTSTDQTVSFGQSYATGVGEVGIADAEDASPVTQADAYVADYTTDGNGDVDGMIMRADNTISGTTVTFRWRFAGRPA